MRTTENSKSAGWIYLGFRSAVSLVGIIAILVSLTLFLHAQNNPSSYVGAAVNGHGVGWQSGAVKTWMAVGTLTTYRYDAQGRQAQEAFPMTLLHATGPAGDGSRGDKLQRLVFEAPPEPTGMKGASNSVAGDLYSPNAILTKVGTDGITAWHSAGPLSTAATGRSERFIESQTDRSLEALFNYQKHGRGLADITAKILGQGPSSPGAGNGNGGGNNAGGHNRSHATPNFEAAQDRHVIEMAEGGGGANRKTTRYYIDDATSMVVRMEFDYDMGKDPFSGKSIPLTEVYEFSDYREVPISAPSPLARPGTGNPSAGTVKFPFMIERYILGQKVETMVFHQVMLNRNLRPENFKR